MRPGQPGPRQPEAPGQPQQNGPRQPQPPGQPGPSQRRDLRRRQIPLPETANPMAKDFSAPHGGVYGVHFAKRWMQTFEVVRRRPEFRPIAIHTLSKARNGNKQILSVQFGNFILEGTWPRIMEVLFMRIIQATEDFFEGDTAAQMAASNAAQHYMHYMWVGSNAAQIAASNAAEMDAAEMDAAENAAVMAAINAAEKAIAGQMARMADSNDSQELIWWDPLAGLRLPRWQPATLKIKAFLLHVNRWLKNKSMYILLISLEAYYKRPKAWIKLVWNLDFQM